MYSPEATDKMYPFLASMEKPRLVAFTFQTTPSNLPFPANFLDKTTSLKLFIISHGRNTSRDVAEMIRQANRLREVELEIGSGVNVHPIHQAIESHPSIQDLSIIATTQQVRILVQCPALLRLKCGWLPSEEIPILLAHAPFLESLEFEKSIRMDAVEGDYEAVLRALETNSRVQKLRLKTWSNPQSDRPFNRPSVHEQLRRTLVSNKVFTNLVLAEASQNELEVLAEMLANNNSYLKHGPAR